MDQHIRFCIPRGEDKVTCATNLLSQHNFSHPVCRENLSSFVQLMAAVFVNFKSALVAQVSYHIKHPAPSCPNFFSSY